MVKKINIDNVEYEIDKISDNAKKLFSELVAVDETIIEKTNLSAIFIKAKKAYIAEIKSEIISKKGGFDFSE